MENKILNVLNAFDSFWSFINVVNKDKIICTYCLFDKITKKFYIGSSSDFDKRLRRHISSLNCNTHGNKNLQAVYSGSFDSQFIVKFTTFIFINTAIEFEQELLDYYHKTDCLFNIAIDARKPQKGLKLSPDHREKLILAMRNRVYSDEVLERMRIASTGRIVSEETRQKMRLSMMGKNIGKKHTSETKERLRILTTGRKYSAEIREKLRLSKLGRKNTPETKRNMQIASENRMRALTVDNVIYKSIREASIFFKLSESSVADRCRSVTGKFDNWRWVLK